MYKKIENAIIIHGPGRSGTTLLYNLFSAHPDVYWLSNYNSKFPNRIWPTFVNRLDRVKWIRFLLKKSKYKPEAAEAYAFWDYYLHGGIYMGDAQKFDDRDVTKLMSMLNRICNIETSRRFVTKLTGKSRIEFIQKVFHDPKIVYIDRDPRLVVTSYYKQRWGYKKKVDLWKKTPKSELIELYTDMYLRNYNARTELEPLNVKYLKYENLVQDMLGEIRSILEFVGIEYTDEFESRILKTKLRHDTAEAFLELFDGGQRALVEEKLAIPIRELGY